MYSDAAVRPHTPVLIKTDTVQMCFLSRSSRRKRRVDQIMRVGAFFFSFLPSFNEMIVIVRQLKKTACLHDSVLRCWKGICVLWQELKIHQSRQRHLKKTGITARAKLPVKNETQTWQLILIFHRLTGCVIVSLPTLFSVRMSRMRRTTWHTLL